MKKIFIILLCFCFSVTTPVGSQSDESGSIEKDELKISDGKREEIQRYFGYETLLFRYITLPYDASIGVNQQGNFVDIGFILIAILPIAFLGITFRNKRHFYIIIGILLLYILICFSNSTILSNNIAYSPNSDNWNTLNSINNSNWLDNFLHSIYKISVFIISPILLFVKNISTGNDYFTYPVLFILILLILYFASKKAKNSFSLLLIIFISYSCLWILLSGGIIWYGYLFIPLSFLFILYSIELPLENVMIKYIHKLIIGSLIFWFLLIGVNRISNIDNSLKNQPEHIGKTILNGSLFPFSLGLLNEKQTLDYLSPNLSKGLDRINSDDKLVYMVGTSLSFNVKNSYERIYSDNLLETFYWLNRIYKEKDVIIKALKASNFKYVVVDLNTPTLDRTPEKSLTSKYKVLIKTLYNNPTIRLIATDRITEITDNNGQKQAIANVFGEKIINFGSYAIYEIL